MITTERSSKADIIDHACELVDDQAEQIVRLKEDRKALWILASCLLVATIF